MTSPESPSHLLAHVDGKVEPTPFRRNYGDSSTNTTFSSDRSSLESSTATSDKSSADSAASASHKKSLRLQSAPQTEVENTIANDSNPPSARSSLVSSTTESDISARSSSRSSKSSDKSYDFQYLKETSLKASVPREARRLNYNAAAENTDEAELPDALLTLENDSLTLNLGATPTGSVQGGDAIAFGGRSTCASLTLSEINREDINPTPVVRDSNGAEALGISSPTSPIYLASPAVITDDSLEVDEEDVDMSEDEHKDILQFAGIFEKAVTVTIINFIHMLCVKPCSYTC